MESSVNLLSKSQNPVILSINRQTYLRKIKKEKINQDQIVEDPAIPGGDLPFFIKYFIILSIWSDSMINATICIVDPHFSQIRGLIPYTLFISRAQADLLALPFTSWLCSSALYSSSHISSPSWFFIQPSGASRTIKDEVFQTPFVRDEYRP